MAKRKTKNPLDTLIVGTPLDGGSSYGKRLIIPIEINGAPAIAIDIDVTTSGDKLSTHCCLATMEDGGLSEGRSTICTIQRRIPPPPQVMPDEAETKET